MKYIFSLFSSLLLFLCIATPIYAQQPQLPQQEFIKAKVLVIKQQGSKELEGVKNVYQVIEVQFLNGKEQGKEVTIQSGFQSTLTQAQIVKQGETIVLIKMINTNGQIQYMVYDTYRINSIILLLLLFFVIVIAIARWKGVGSVIGLTISLAVIFIYIIPQIVAGQDPLFVSITGSLIILLFTTYLAHGISKQTTVALFSTFISLMITAWFSQLFVGIAHLTGLNEETSSLQFGPTSIINIKSFLLGGIIIGTLGALNDVTTTQAAAVFELAKLDNKLSVSELFKKGFIIGREHVVSLVNTLVLAYAGSSMALFLFIIVNPQKLPFWVIINGEDISDEIIRTVAGSLGLILVVPIVTLLAAIVCNKQSRQFLKYFFNSFR